ncbi:MAG: GNAT family N-acetyltransferase [Acidimicrobiia bacterium]
MSDDMLRWPGGWARMGPWRGQADVAYLAIGAQQPPRRDLVDQWLGTLRSRGYRRVVTNALAPAETLPFVDAGFRVHERLHLLVHDLEDLPEPRYASRRARPGDRDAVLAIDERAFAPFWQLDADGLDQAVGATPTARFRVLELDDVPAAYAVTGRADRRGYLQRVGVDPAHQRLGLGRALVADALRWLRRHRARSAVVNTQLDNDAALALYEACGFREQPSGLCVMSRAL